MSGGWQRLARWGPPLAVVALVIAFAWRLALTQGILGRGDTFLYFYPYWEYRAQALLAGRLPLWEPLLFMGAPFLANSQAGVLYPPNWPLAVFSAPLAVKIALVTHLALMALGTYAFARRAAGQSRLGALTAATLFALGGYVTAQMEHVNQLQGLAWLPWLMLGAHALLRLDWQAAGARGRAAALAGGVAALVALQILAGHTQTAFISVAGAGLYAGALAVGAQWRGRRADGVAASRNGALAGLGLLLAAVAGAAVLAAAQVLPTLELSGQSLRGGGLPLREALSFSLDPRLLGRALLPGYSRVLFSEFVGYVGVTGLALAVLGLARTRERLALAVLAAVGLAFALGAYDPLYLGLASLPPFNLFRVPARWLVLLAWGGALLAGYGLDSLVTRPTWRRLAAACALPLGLMALTPLAAALVPAGETGPLGLPARADVVGWLLPLALVAVLAWLPANVPWRRSAVAALATVELFVAAQGLPYNQLTTPEAWSSVRPAMTQLLAADAGRFLSISALRFEPGDQAELASAFAGQLNETAFYDFLIATKHKEVLSPNLPLAWGVPAVDGYDGGVLPLRHYADFTTLFTGAASPDGRLRENVSGAPDPRLLALVNGRYLITDKVNDAWLEDVFYDLEFTLTLAAGERSQIAYLPRFTATAVGVVAEAYGGTLTLTTADGTATTLPVTGSRVTLPAPMTAVTLTLEGPLTVRGLALIDERSGAFQTLTLGPYRLVHSGDVKVYEHQAVLARAFVVGHAETADDAAALARLADPAFDVSATVLLAEAGIGDEPNTNAPARPATITRDTPEAVTVLAEGPGYLLLTDAYYPGWMATVDGQATPIMRADVMFRAVALPAGAHEVVFTYAPRSVAMGLWVSAAAWALLTAALLVGLRRRLKTAHV